MARGRRCEHAGRVTETVPVEVRFPVAAVDGLVVTAELRQATVAPQRARFRYIIIAGSFQRTERVTANWP